MRSFLPKPVYPQQLYHLILWPKMSPYTFRLRFRLAFVLSLSSRKYVSWNGVSVNPKQMMPSLKSGASGALFKDFGSSND
jgi:hypothetical protein